MLALGGVAGAQEEGGSLEQTMAEMAHTKAEHQALASYYTQQAAAARKEAKRHHAMHRAYLGSKAGNKQAFVSHCMRLAEQQEAMAKEFDALAKLHEAEAANAQ
jgi:hypothetical protein